MKKIRTAASGLPEGHPVTIGEFAAFGSRDSVDQALSRLVKEGALLRPARGIYMTPKHNRFVGAVPPDPQQIAEALATASGYRLQVHGAEAARRLGLSTQVPMVAIFLTDGPSRVIRLGERRVELRRVSPRKLALTGRPAGLALTALWYLGKENVTPETIAYLRERLGPTEFQALCREVARMPGWLRKLIQSSVSGGNND